MLRRIRERWTYNLANQIISLSNQLGSSYDSISRRIVVEPAIAVAPIPGDSVTRELNTRIHTSGRMIQTDGMHLPFKFHWKLVSVYLPRVHQFHGSSGTSEEYCHTLIVGMPRMSFSARQMRRQEA